MNVMHNTDRLRRRLLRAEQLLERALRRLEDLHSEETGPDPTVRAIKRFLKVPPGSSAPRE